MPFSKIIELAEAVATGKCTRDQLAKEMKKLSDEQICIDKHLTWSETGYTRNQVYCSDNVEVVITCFQGDQESPPHDHGGSWGMVVPYRGSINNCMFELVSGNQVRKTGTKVQQAGDVLILEKEEIHQVVANTCKDHGDRHISIHCYFPPIPKMNEYVVAKEAAGSSNGK